MFRYTTIYSLLSKDECDQILNFSLSNLELKNGKVGNMEVNLNARKSNVAFVSYDDIFPYLKERLYSRLSEFVKIKGYQINFENQPYQFTEYKTGEYYKWHTDSSVSSYASERYCSIVIQLNDAYSNGELQMMEDDGEVISFDFGVGNCFVFLSSIKHQVNTVTEGTRYSLVSWFTLKPIEGYAKTLI